VEKTKIALAKTRIIYRMQVTHRNLSPLWVRIKRWPILRYYLKLFSETWKKFKSVPQHHGMGNMGVVEVNIHTF
jgi:hypothetical protein